MGLGKEPSMRWFMAFTCLLFTFTAAVAQPPPARVVVTEVFEKKISPTTPLVGIVDYDTTAGISSEISGLIVQQYLIEGTVVSKGAVLVRLNTDFIQKDMDIIEKEIAELDHKIANNKKNLKRFETLFQQNVTSEKDYDDLASQLKELLTQKDALRVKYAKKDLELAKSTIRAPFKGLVVERFKNQGEWIAPGESICQLAAVDEVVVQVAMSERLIPFVKVGQPIMLTVTALGKSFTGKLKTIVPKVDVKSKTFDIKISIDYQPGLLQNMSAMVNVPTGSVKQLKMIKRDALVRFKGKDFVYTVKDGQAKILPIEVAAVDGEYLGVEVPHIVAGMPIVIDGNERLRPDQKVQVVNKSKDNEVKTQQKKQ
jgi:RND family efflux transporter MFP subunit